MAQLFTSENFDAEVLQAKEPVLVDFYADWCGPCKMMAPVVEQIAEKYAGKAKVGKIDIDKAEDIAGRYGIMSIPTLVIFKNGEAAQRFVGVQDRNSLESALSAQIG